MDILDRYLAHIERNLPSVKRADIVEEIADELQSQFEERETSLGRPLTRDEAAETIRAYGSPRVVAGRYAEQQYLIGPELLPFYWYALKTLIVIAVGLVLFGSAIRAVALNDASAFWNGMAAGWESPVWIFGIVTIVFALLQHFGQQWPERWDPRALQPIGTGVYVSRIMSAFEFTVNVALLLATLTVASHWEFMHNDTWRPIYLAIVASCSINAIALCVTYIQPEWGRVRLFGQVAASAVNVVGLGLALRALGPSPSLLHPLFGIFLAAVGAAGAVAIWNLVRHRDAPAIAGIGDAFLKS